MKLEFNEEQLLELMKDFYISSGIRIVLFDDEYQELLSYPAKDCSFCRLMKSQKETRALCAQSDLTSFKECDTGKKLIVYHCHAGLIEAVIPLLDNHVIIGYLMFGQISDCTDTAELITLLQSYLHKYGLPDIENIIADIPLKTSEQIHAAAKIMEACTFYALFNETIALRRHNFTNNLREFLLQHIAEPLDAKAISEQLGISRSKLYLTCDKYLGTGIAQYLRALRIEKSQTLLKTTDKPMSEIADMTGFADYNYFSKVFKKSVGMTPGEFRKLHR